MRSGSLQRTNIHPLLIYLQFFCVYIQLGNVKSNVNGCMIIHSSVHHQRPNLKKKKKMGKKKNNKYEAGIIR